MKYLITGGAGFIVSHLTDALLSRGDEVIVFDDLSSGSLINLNHQKDNHRLKVISARATINGIRHLNILQRSNCDLVTGAVISLAKINFCSNA